MSFRKDVDEMMKNVQVDYEMTNNIMNNTVRNSGKKYRGFRKKAIVVVTLATLCIGTMAVGVSGFSGAWNNIVQLIQHKGIEMDEAQAVNFSKKGYIDVADADKVTATNNGIAVSLIQTISDKKAIYLYLKVKSKDKKLNNGMSFVGAKINIKGFGNIDGVAGDLNVTSDYEGVFEVRMDVLSEYKEKNLDIDGKDIELTLNCLRQVYKTSADYKVNDDIAQGEWKINWKGKSNNSSKVIKPNQTIIHHKNKLTVIKMEITPLTVTIDFDYPARKEYEEIYIPFTVVMKDGTKYKTTESGFNTIFYGDVMLILDINLPDGNGLDLLRALRRESEVPVILLTANDLETDIVAGLELGADDYITKPFSLAVLRARVNTQLRRTAAPRAEREFRRACQ